MADTQAGKRTILILSGQGEELVRRYTHVDLTPESLASRQMALKQISEEALQVVELLIQGKTIKQMAAINAALTEQAVYRHLQALRKLFKVQTNEALIARIFQTGIDMWLVDIKRH